MRNVRTSCVNDFLTLSMASPIIGGSRSARGTGTVGSGRCGCDSDAASIMPAYLISSCSTGACGPAVALAGVRTDCLPPWSPALLASVAAIAATVAVRIAINSWSCWFRMKRLISSTSIWGLLVSGVLYLKSVTQRCCLRTTRTSQHCFVHRFMLLFW